MLSEITRRMQLADKFKTEDKLVDACTRCGASWRQIISKELPKTPRKEKPEPSWAEFRKATLSRWLREVNGDDTRHAELLTLLQDAVRSMSEAEVVTA